METERPKDSQPDHRIAASGSGEIARGAGQKKKHGNKKQNGRNAKKIKIPLGALQPEVQQDLEERRMFMRGSAGKKCAKYRGQGPDGIAEHRGLVRDEDRTVICSNQANAQQKQGNRLLRKFAWFTLAGRHG